MMNHPIKKTLCLVISAMLISPAFGAGYLKIGDIKGESAGAKAPAALQAQQPAPPQCGAGFSVKNPQLKTSGSKTWYEYRCERSIPVIRSCNGGQKIFMEKNDVKKTFGPPAQSNSVIELNYSCGFMEG